MSILKYKSNPKVYSIQSTEKPYLTTNGDLTFREEFLSNDEYSNISSEHGDYYVIIQSEADNSKELQWKHFEIQDVCQELDRAWMYACGHPLSKRHLNFVGPYIEVPDGKIDGWTSNFDEVQKEINKGKPHIEINFKQISHSTLQYWPLEKALIIREAYLKAQKPITALVDLHFYSHKVGDSYSSFFFLAKAMELVRLLLPGKTDKQKEGNLPDQVRKKLVSSMHHIIGLANTRLEIRHIVKDPQKGTLHDRMNNPEIDAYRHDSDLIIRAVVSKELGIPLIIVNRN